MEINLIMITSWTG